MLATVYIAVIRLDRSDEMKKWNKMVIRWVYQFNYRGMKQDVEILE